MAKTECPHCGNWIDPASLLGKIMTEKKRKALQSNLVKANEALALKRKNKQPPG